MTPSVDAARVSDIDDAQGVSDEIVAAYRKDGFVRLRGVLSPEEVERYRQAAEGYLATHQGDSFEGTAVFDQFVNVWQRDETLRELTLNQRLGRVAEQLAGFPLRIWHDQMLVKLPHNDAATEFHQDRQYWPHSDDRLALSAWIALVDVPPERGCMTFLPGTQHVTGLRPQDFYDDQDLFAADESMRWMPRVTVPLRAGDCTFHSSFTGHMALSNRTDQARFAHVNIYIDVDTIYSGAEHPVTDPLGLTKGDRFGGDSFPRPWGEQQS